MELTIRQATVEDLDLLTQLSQLTFTEAYSGQNTAADIDFYLKNYFNREWTLVDLQDANTVFYLAFKKNELAGYVKVKQMQEDLLGIKRPNMEMKRLYVLKAFYGKGIAQELLKTAEKYTLEKGLKELDLAVWKENTRAIAFYLKTGFTIAGETTFDWGTGKIDSDWVMRKNI